MKKFFLFSVLTIVIVFLSIPKKQSQVFKKNTKLIYIDPGHGGIDGGTMTSDGTFEKDIVLEIAQYLGLLFIGNGFDVKYSRTGDYDLASENSQNRKREDIRKRVKLINSSQALLYISIHANSYPSPICYGAQTFYKRNNQAARRLAESIQGSIIVSLNNTKREALPIDDKYLIDNVTKVGCLVEVGFLSNPREAMLLKTVDYQQAMATAIFLGAMDFLELSL